MTGAHYSVVRILSGVCISIFFLADVFGSGSELCYRSECIANWLFSAAAVIALLFAAGWRDREMASLLLVVVAARLGLDGGIALTLFPATWFLVQHLFTPAAPYGSWGARGREDPAGDWRYPRLLKALSWVCFAASLIMLIQFNGPRESWAWAYLGIVYVLFLFERSWLPGKICAATEYIFFDGSCALCHGLVRWVLSEEGSTPSFLFAPLGGETFKQEIDAELQEGLPDSVVVTCEDGAVRVRSRAVLHIAQRTGGIWRIFATLAGILPESILDFAYDVIASIRYRLFGRKKESCPLMPPTLRARFRQ